MSRCVLGITVYMKAGDVLRVILEPYHVIKNNRFSFSLSHPPSLLFYFPP